jgi:hypothetical protein
VQGQAAFDAATAELNAEIEETYKDLAAHKARQKKSAKKKTQ